MTVACYYEDDGAHDGSTHVGYQNDDYCAIVVAAAVVDGDGDAVLTHLNLCGGRDVSLGIAGHGDGGCCLYLDAYFGDVDD